MANIYEQLLSSPALFSVRREPVFTESGQKFPGRVAIVNEETGRPLGLVSPRYNVVTNDKVAHHVSDSLEASGLDLTGAKATVRLAYGGARTMVDIELPAVRVEPRPGDVSNLRINVLNSYDGRWKFMARAGAIRLACMNGQVLGSFIGSYSAYHNSKLDVEQGARQMVGMAMDFLRAEEWWAQLISRPVDREQLLRSLALFLTGDTRVRDREAFLKLPSVRKLMQLWDAYSGEMGPNAYALYNVLTDYVTHRKRRPDVAAAAELNEQLRLETKVLRSKIFALAE